MMNRVLFILFCLLIFGCRKVANNESEIQYSNSINQGVKFFPVKKPAGKYREGIVLVRFKNNESQRAVSKAKIGRRYLSKAMQSAGYNGFYAVQSDDVMKEISRLKSHPDVMWAEPDWIQTTQTIPDDTYWNNGSLWGMQKIGASIAWQSGNVGRHQVIVANIDEGNLCTHPENNMWKNPYEQEDGMDNDGNGYIDDIYGWNWFNGNNQVYFGNDDHGTHTAGTIGAQGGNQIGVIGVSPYVQTMTLKFLADFGYTSDAVLALDYALDMKNRHGLEIVCSNNSWGGGGYSQALYDAIERNLNGNIGFVAAAGNSNTDNDTNPMYPASYNLSGIISVGASTSGDTKASFSNVGVTTVDLFAPGVGIWSTLPVNHQPGYGSYSGTSMATPHVSGAAALYKAVHPAATWADIRNAILNSVDVLPSFAGLCVTGGRLNVSTFTGLTDLEQPVGQVCPPFPMDLEPPVLGELRKVSQSGNTVVFEWDAVTDAGSGVDWVVLVMDNWQQSWWFPPSFTGATWGNLTDGTHRWWLQAVDAWGNWTDTSNNIVATITTSPDTSPPVLQSGLEVSNITQTSVDLSWAAATDNVATTGYNVIVDGNTINVGNVLNYTTTGFLPGTLHTFSYNAYDAAGNTSGNSPTLNITTQNQPPPPPPQYTITATLSGNSPQVLPDILLNYNIITNGTITAVRMERKKGGEQFILIANLPLDSAGTYTDSPGSPGQYTYRLYVTIQELVPAVYSNEKLIHVKKK